MILNCFQLMRVYCLQINLAIVMVFACNAVVVVGCVQEVLGIVPNYLIYELILKAPLCS